MSIEHRVVLAAYACRAWVAARLRQLWKRSCQPIVVMTGVLALTACAGHEAAAVDSDGQSHGLPLRSDLQRLELDNGLQVLLLPRAQHEGVELRLLVKAGSLNETAEQRGLAHFVEHMAFKGTTHFPGDQGVKTLERQGINLGADINAVTGFASTGYRLSLPDGQDERLEVALRLMADWAFELSFEAEAFEREREVIVEEWRMRQGVGFRINQQLDHLRYLGSDYQDRSPIGELEVVRHAPLEQARAFYQRWYQPQRMTLVVVGDFDVANVRERIQHWFAAAPRGDSQASAPRFSTDTALQAKVLFDAEQSQPLVQFALQRHLPNALDTQAGQWRDLLDSLWLAALDQRLQTRVEQRRIDLASVNERPQLLDARQAQALFVVRPVQQDYLSAMNVLFEELQRLALHPLSNEALAAAREPLLARLRNQAAAQERYENDVLADGLVTSVEYRLPMLDKRQQLEMTEQWLASIQPQHVQAAVADWLEQGAPRLALIGPARPDAGWSQVQLRERWQQARAARLQDWQEAAGAGAGQLQLALPKASSLERLPDLDAVASTQWRLGNGIRVIVKADAKLQGNVQFDLRRSGGSSLETADRRGSQALAIQLAERSGYGEYSPAMLQRFSQQHQLTVVPYSESLFQGVRGSAPADELEAWMQLLHVKLSQPRFDDGQWQALRESVRLKLSNQPVELRFMNSINRTAFVNGHRLMADAQGPWQRFTVEQLRQVHAGLFGDLRGMTLVVSGPLDEGRLLHLARRWLGSLPASTGSAQGWQDMGVVPRHVPMSEHYPWSTSPKSMVSILYSAPADWQADRVLALQLLDRVVSLRLRQALRSEASGTYTLGFAQMLTRIPQPYYLGRLNFSSAPQRADELAAMAMAVIEEVAGHGVSLAELQQARQALMLDQREQRRDSHYWTAALMQVAQVDGDFAGLADEPDRLRRLSLEQVNQVARQWMGRNAKVFIMQPE